MNIEKTYSKLRFWRSLEHKTRWITNLRLRNKFILIFLISIIPFFGLIYYSYTSTRDQITEQTYASLSGTLNQINTNIENRLDYYHQLSNIMYMDSQLRNYLSNNYEQAFYYLDAFEYINRQFSSMLALNTNVRGITIYIDNKTLYSDGEYIRYTEELPETVRKLAIEAAGDTVYTQTDDHTIMLARSLSYFSLTHPYGILIIQISDAELYSLIEKENNNKSVYIIDQTGRVITTSDKSLGSKRLYDTFPIEDELQSNFGKFDKQVNGEGRFFTYKELSNGWRTVITVPYHELLANTNKATTRIIWISIITFAASILLIYLTTKVITKRIEKLLLHIRKVERGNFQGSVQFMGHDEIGQLSFAFNKMALKIQDLIEDVYVKEISTKEAELTTLQAQINPHFLYNTLASISSLALKEGGTQVYQMVNYLAKYYRISLNKGKRIILVNQEIQLVKNYIAIQEIRFRGMLHMHYDLDEDLFKFTTIKLILQPFIENCINHAICHESGINIIVKLRVDGEDILFQVIDDGAGMSRGHVEDAFQKANNLSGYGIKNVNDRIQLTYGEQYGVDVFSRIGIGTTVTLRIPKRYSYEV
ncbi:two-component sensor histidine kinase [Paenibacillus selenitireducens]|uniref:Two-component sensor histidine kinase n=1 Tax=Paenibacillus selenitireducens TaxID=1324314 RepID=A0A1T2X295_9BACL|nr:sensor histidine kinase [Paenibacillus selenitireducens]OPA74011.1 two-component sensor histidine kinase [Paenibacillus selenitireducens]